MTLTPPHHPVVNKLDAERAKHLELQLADRITASVGSMRFVYLHVLLFAVWMLVFEENPWPTLTLAVSIEAIFLSCFVMIGQNNQAAFQQAKADHEYQQGERELKLNTELTRAIHNLTREVHERVLTNASTTPRGSEAADRPRTTTGQVREGTWTENAQLAVIDAHAGPQGEAGEAQGSASPSPISAT